MSIFPKDFLGDLSTAEVSITGATTLTASAFGKLHVCSGTAADYTVGLPAVSGNAGKLIGFRMSPALTKLVTLDGNSSEVIDEETTRVMWAQESAILFCDGSKWTKIAGRTRPMACLLRLGANQTGVVTDVQTTVALDTVNLDNTGRMADAANNKILIARPGQYEIMARVRFNSLTAIASRAICIFGLWHADNALSTASTAEFYGTSGGYQTGIITLTVPAVLADYLLLYGQHNAGANQTFAGGSSVECGLSAVEVPSW